jgi:tetratricopeptide (TPR) repeat protein
VQLYGGGFLDGLFLKDALEFEEWAREERDRFARAYAQALEELAENASQRGDHSKAVSWWRDLVAHDPYSGRATVRLMESLAAAGDRAEALRQADAHAVQMREAFNAAPDGAVTELADRLRAEPTKGTEARTVTTAAGRRMALPQSVRRHWLRAAVVAPILGLAVWYITLKDDGAGPEQAPGATAAPAIAVLPFSVRGEELAVLREGMVDLLSTGLDGAGGLRAIPASTLLVRWREHVPGEEAPELTTALEVARRARAQYALVGSVVAIDSDVRIMVGIYDVNTDERLGQAHVEGSPEDVLPLVDRLAVDVLRVILQRGEEELPEIDLTRLMTTSPKALKAYLEGEVHFRHFDLAAAGEAYRQAVEADSTFALAHYQLSKVYWWDETGATIPLSRSHIRRAVQLADRLPARQAVLVRAVFAQLHQTSDPVETLRQAVQMYPDDVEIWYLLGEALLHIPAAMASPEEIDQAFERAVELDPRNEQYLWHYLHLAWNIHGDSLLAAWRLKMYERVDPADPFVREGRLALDLAFGDSVAQGEAMTQLRSEEDTQLARYVAFTFLFQPRFVALERVMRLLLERRADSQTSRLAEELFYAFRVDAFWHGRLRQALLYLDDPGMSAGYRAETAYNAFRVGLPIPEETLEQALDPALIDSVAPRFAVFYAGAFAADRGRWPDHADAIVEFERRAEKALGDTDSIVARRNLGAVRALEGYALWQQGQPKAALPMLEDRHALNPWRVVRPWLGQLYLELGHLRDAERVYRSHTYYGRGGSLWTEPLSQRQLGKIYEQLEEYDKARESYEYFVEYWQDADPELQPMVEEARQAIIRLKGLRRE